MSVGSISGLSSSYLQSILATAQNGLATNGHNTGQSGFEATRLLQRPDDSRLSFFPQTLGALQQLLQSDPPKYGQDNQQAGSNSGQHPNMQDLTQATGAHPHHRHHHVHSMPTGTSDSSTDTAGTNQAQKQLLSEFQSNSTLGDALSPIGTMLNTLV